jgi:hypothetical protein
VCPRGPPHEALPGHAPACASQGFLGRLQEAPILTFSGSALRDALNAMERFDDQIMGGISQALALPGLGAAASQPLKRSALRALRPSALFHCC